jgi:hypothetical protein
MSGTLCFFNDTDSNIFMYGVVMARDPHQIKDCLHKCVANRFRFVLCLPPTIATEIKALQFVWEYPHLDDRVEIKKIIQHRLKAFGQQDLTKLEDCIVSNVCRRSEERMMLGTSCLLYVGMVMFLMLLKCREK